MKKSILLLFVSYLALVACNKSAFEQCLNRIFPGKELQDVKWIKVTVEAFYNDNHDYQCFLHCALSNLKILTQHGLIETQNNPLASELGDEIAKCSARVKSTDDKCVNAKNSAKCLFENKVPLNVKSTLGKIVINENVKFKKSGQEIE